MDTPPATKPRTAFFYYDAPQKSPIPLPRTNLSAPVDSRQHDTNFCFANTVSTSQETVGNTSSKGHMSKSSYSKLDKAIEDGKKIASRGFERTLSSSRALRDSLTKSVIETTKYTSLRLRRSEKKDINSDITTDKIAKSQSLSEMDVRLFDNIQFHSPLMENYSYENHEIQSERPDNSQGNYDQLSTKSVLTVDSESNNSSEDIHNISLSSLSIDHTVPELPQREKNIYTRPLLYHTIYENWDIVNEDNKSNQISVTPEINKCTIDEFDPLNYVKSNYNGVSNEALLLRSFKTVDKYGTVVSKDDDDIVELCESEHSTPPTPPDRQDSLTNTTSAVKEGTSKWFTEIDDMETAKVVGPSDCSKLNYTSSMKKRLSNMLKLDVLNKSSRKSLPEVKTVMRPPISLQTLTHSGNLLRIPGTSQHSSYCVLAQQKIIMYANPKTLSVKKEFHLNEIYSVQRVTSSSHPPASFLIEIMVSSGDFKSAPKKIVFNFASCSERLLWIHKIIDSLIPAFPNEVICEVARYGWSYLKEGVSGNWQGSWLIQYSRMLGYITTNDVTMKNIELQKVRNISEQESDEVTKEIYPSDGSGVLLLNTPDLTLYLHFPHERELKSWKTLLSAEARNNGGYLHEQQLTNENVPTIVDKCIRFISSYGSLTEGIYRRGGSQSALLALMSRFREDAWSVQLNPTEHSEHDVAGVLKRFFRDLVSSLINEKMHESMLSAFQIPDRDARHKKYNELMYDNPAVVKNTLRKLFQHLHFIQSLSTYNKMTVENLACIWTPNIIAGMLTTNSSCLLKEVQIIAELILEYEAIWKPSDAEKQMEASTKELLLKMSGNVIPTAPKRAGDLRVWIYVNDKNTNYQVTLTPNKTSDDVCTELCEKIGVEGHLLMIEEVICKGTLKRIIHFDEIVLDVVLRWGYWDEDDRKDNYLLVKDNKLLQDMDNLKFTVTSMYGPLKYANESTKVLKTHIFELHSIKLTCYKQHLDNSSTVNEWRIEDIIWYDGHDLKRNIREPWSITLIPKKNKANRSKEHPFFGCTLAGSVNEDQMKWMAAMMFAEHETILPTPRLVIPKMM